MKRLPNNKRYERLAVKEEELNTQKEKSKSKTDAWMWSFLVKFGHLENKDLMIHALQFLCVTECV